MCVRTSLSDDDGQDVPRFSPKQQGFLDDVASQGRHEGRVEKYGREARVR